ncbi:hypothetical protein LIER_09674 [Lithospermum erythrorhizon]|uniref:Uncharacterized protein n=1 Tax=Lithospermum erythrorhizon TaxID=34254 RepID=A0AAV3PGN5_LITER
MTRRSSGALSPTHVFDLPDCELCPIVSDHHPRYHESGDDLLSKYPHSGADVEPPTAAPSLLPERGPSRRA